MTRTPTAAEMAAHRVEMARSATNARDFLFHTYMSKLAAAATEQDHDAFQQARKDLRELFDDMNTRLTQLEARN